MNNQDQMRSIKDNTVNWIISLKDEIINLKEIVIRNLQDKNEKLKHRCEQLEKRCSKYESDHNALAQYGQQNKVVLSGIPELVSEDVLKESVISVLADIDFLLQVKILTPAIGLANLIEIVTENNYAFCELEKLQSFI